MDKNLFERVDPIVDGIADQLSELVSGEALDGIKQKITALSEELASLSVTLELNVRVFDPDKERSLPLLQTGLSSSGGAAPYQVWEDSTPHRYVVDGDVVVVPHDHCPACWGGWGFKHRNPQCPECSICMGDRVKLLLDTDCCPMCEEGTVTSSEPRCSRCDFSVNPDHVNWG